MLAARAGDTKAFAELVERHGIPVYRLCFAILRSHAEAEDAAQETMIHAWRELPKLRRPGAWSGWLRRIAVRSSIDVARSRRRLVEIDPAIPSLSRDPADGSADRDEMERALLTLAPSDRALLVLRFYIDLEVPDIAEAMGIPVGTAKSRLHRAIAQLRRILDGER